MSHHNRFELSTVNTDNFLRFIITGRTDLSCSGYSIEFTGATTDRLLHSVGLSYFMKPHPLHTDDLTTDYIILA